MLPWTLRHGTELGLANSGAEIKTTLPRANGFIGHRPRQVALAFRGYVRMMLDNNIWTYVGERGLAPALERFEARTPQLTHVVAPSVLLEVIRTPVVDVRDSIVAAMTSRRRERIHPLPEARQEADELVAAIGRYRPEWLRRFAEPGSVAQLEAFWTRRIWQMAAENPDEIAGRQQRDENGAAEEISTVQRENQHAALENKFRLKESEPWAELESAPQDLTVGWKGNRIESWRLESAMVWWSELVVLARRQRQSSYADWVRPWVDLDRIAGHRGRWNDLWYSEVTAEELPRVRMRSVLPWAQMQVGLGTGDARDAQHAAYLFDVDVFITADRRFARVLDLVRRWTTLPFAAVEFIPAVGNTVAEIENVMGRRLMAAKAEPRGG